MIEICGKLDEFTLNSDLDVWYFLWALYKAQMKYHPSKSELSVDLCMHIYIYNACITSESKYQKHALSSNIDSL